VSRQEGHASDQATLRDLYLLCASRNEGDAGGDAWRGRLRYLTGWKPVLLSLRRFGGFGFSLGSCRLWRRGGEIHPFEDRPLRGVALALAEFDDACVAAVAFLEGGRQLFEQDADEVFVGTPGFAPGLGPVKGAVLVTQTRCGQPPKVPAPP